MSGRHQANMSKPKLWGNESGKPLSVSAVLTPSGTEIGIILLATMLAVASYFGVDGSFEWSLYLVPTILIVGLAWGAVRMTTLDIASIWSPLFWNRVVLILYFGVGSIVPVIVNDKTRTTLESFYHFFSEDVKKYNLIVSLFITLFLISVKFLLRIFNNTKYSAHRFEESNISQKSIGVILLIIGLSISFFILTPNAYGIYNIKIPTLVNEVSQGAYIGIFFLTIWALNNKSRLIYLLIAIVIVQFGLGFLELNKSSAMFPLMMFAVGFIYHKPSVARFLGSFSILLAIFMLISPIVAHGRTEGEFIRSTDDAVSVSLRYRALTSYFEVGGESEDSEIDVGWLRLSYVNAATFAVNQYDTGSPGNSLDNIFVIWIPRIIYPAKPIITDIARDFNYAATGSYDSQSTPGVIAESYWTLGWTGVFIIAGLLAAVSTFWSIYALDVMRSGAWHLFFIVLLGMRAGSRIDGMIVPDIFGPIGYAVLGHFVLQFLNRMLAGQRSARKLMPV